MSIAGIYSYIFYAIVSIFTMYYVSLYSKHSGSTIHSSPIFYNKSVCNFLIVVLTIFLGTRPVYGNFYDTKVYYYYISSLYDVNYTFKIDTENILWDNFIGYWAKLKWDASLFFTIVEFIYLYCAYIACKKLFPNDVIVSFLVFLAAMSTFAYGTNGIKAGAAASIFLVGLAYHENWKVWLPMLLVSCGLHHSMNIPVLAFVGTFVYKKPKAFFCFWFVCLAMAVAHVSIFQEIFMGYVNEKEASYLITDGEDWAGKSGLRLDFIAYSAIPVLMGLYAVYKQKIEDKTYNILLSLYLLLNAAWMLCMYANYNNRIAYLSWLLYPVVLIYPILNCKWDRHRYPFLAKVVLLHLASSVVMDIIHYK